MRRPHVRAARRGFEQRADRPGDRDHVAEAELGGRVAQRRLEQGLDNAGTATAELGGDLIQDRQRVRLERQVEERHKDLVRRGVVDLVDEPGELLGGILAALGIAFVESIDVRIDKLVGDGDVCIHHAMLATGRPGVTGRRPLRSPTRAARRQWGRRRAALRSRRGSGRAGPRARRPAVERR